MDISKIINLVNMYDLDVIRWNEGYITINGQKQPCYAVIVGLIDEQTKKAIERRKMIIKVGDVHYRHAPEIKYNVVYIKY